jgi:hypothetical protein
MDRASRLNEAAAQAVELMEKLSESDPSDPNSPWRDPHQVFDQLDAARNKVMSAWNTPDDTANFVSEDQVTEDVDFRALYLDMVTDAFADVLEDIRTKENTSVDVNVLVDCLQSGMDFLSSEERDLFFQDDEGDKGDEETPHEKQQQKVGLNVEVHS